MKAMRLLAVCLVLSGCLGEPSVETLPSNYSKVLGDWKRTGIVSHFPMPLPPGAENVKLSAFPGFLQGGGWFQLRFTLPPAEVAKVFDSASNSAKDSYDGGGFFTSTNDKEKKHGLPGTSFHTADTAQTDFPADFRVFVCAATSSGGNSWNHGKSHGVVVSEQRNEVIYFAESW